MPPWLVLILDRLPLILSVVSQAVSSLTARRVSTFLNPRGVYMSDKLVFELFLNDPHEDNSLLGTMIRMVDVKSVHAVNLLIRSSAFGSLGKSAFRVHIGVSVDDGDGLVFYPEDDYQVSNYGGSPLGTIPFYVKNGSRWIVNPMVRRMVGKSFHQL
jgi:hypothetical protein